MKGQLTTPEAIFGFRIGFDAHRYRLLDGTRLRDPAACTVVHTVEVDGIPWRTSHKKLIDLRKKESLKVFEGEVAERFCRAIRAVAAFGGTRKLDCYAFACEFAGIEDGRDDSGDSQWSLTPIERYQTGLFGKIIAMKPLEIDQHVFADGEHWGVSITDNGSTLLHVAGKAGPLMLSSLGTVQDMYPNRFQYVAEPAA